MPPPRLIRPLRSCYPRRDSLQIRWVSYGLRDKLPASDGDAAQALTSANDRDGLTSHDVHENAHQRAPASLWAPFKTAPFAPPLDAAPADQIRIHYATPTETERTHGINVTTHATETSLPSSQSHANPPETSSIEEPTCRTCKAQFASNNQLFLHYITSEKCQGSPGVQGFFCHSCHTVMSTKPDVWAHMLSAKNPTYCLKKLRVLKSTRPLTLSGNWKWAVRKMSLSKYADTISLMIAISKLLETLRPSLAAPMQRMVHEHLRLVEKDVMLDGNRKENFKVLAEFAQKDQKEPWAYERFLGLMDKHERQLQDPHSLASLLAKKLAVLNGPPISQNGGVQGSEDDITSMSLERGRENATKSEPSTTDLVRPVLSIKGTLHAKSQPWSRGLTKRGAGRAAEISMETSKEVVSSTEAPVQSKPVPLPASDSFESLKKQIAMLTEQVKYLTEKMDATSKTSTPNPADDSAEIDAKTPPLRHARHKSNYQISNPDWTMERGLEEKSDSQKLTRQIHTQARLMKTELNSEKGTLPKPEVDNPSPITDTSRPAEMSDQSLLQELFPEATDYVQPHYTPRNPYPKLDPPSQSPLIRKSVTDLKKTKRERYIETFQARNENLTALQLVHCSTELTEMDFRRLIPKAKHIDNWAAGGEFTRVIPGRDPISLERLPFYYLVFRTPESALAYQHNASRLHKLSQLHQPNGILSALPPPKGFLEDGEDVAAAANLSLLRPTDLPLTLHMLMQPYNPALRSILECGGYSPIVPSVTPDNKPLYKVLLQIDGYEPLPSDLYSIIRSDAYRRGMSWPLHNAERSISRLRDVVDIDAKFLPISSMSPRAANANSILSYEDHLKESSSGAIDTSTDNTSKINQEVMNRVYNRWIIDFTDKDAAMRFAKVWHRRLLPKASNHSGSWKDFEVARMCNAEFLW